MIIFLMMGLVIIAPSTIYFAYRSREFRKFLAGAFFVSGGIQFYLYLAQVSIPLLGTSAVQTPGMSAVRSMIHLTLFLICLYFGFIKNPASDASPQA